MKNGELIGHFAKSTIVAALLMPMLNISAYAQSDSEQGPEKKVEKIEVTGSRVKRIDIEGATPVTVFSREQIDASGSVSIADFLRTGDASASLTSENDSLTQSSGSAQFSGRSLGAEYTVVLINGRRLPTNAIGSTFSDLNLIPMAAVERIEYLADGASAIYGADAVAGVLNIITKKEYNGTNVRYQYGQAYDGQGEEESYQIVTGSSNANTSALIAFDYFRREIIRAKDRPLIKSTISPQGHDRRSPTGVPGRVTLLEQGSESIAWEECQDPNSITCPYDFAPLYFVQPKSERQTLFARFDHKVNSDFSIFTEMRYARAYTLNESGAAPDPAGIFVSKDSPYNPYGEDIKISRRYVEFGGRKNDSTNDTFATTLGLKGSVGFHDWELGLSRAYLRNIKVGAGGQVNVQAVREEIEAGRLNPFDMSFNTEEELATKEKIDAETFRQGSTLLKTVDLTFNGPLGIDLPGGELQYAAGLAGKVEEYEDKSDQLLQDDLIAGGAGANGGGKTQSRSVFGELNLPIFENLELSLAGRFDDLFDTGTKFTYKSAVSYRPITSLLVRGSYGTGFKSPNLHDIYLQDSFGVGNAIDPVACSKFGLCEEIEISSISSGNKNLKPENSSSYNAGVIFQALENVSIQADYWNISIVDVIGALTIQEILNDEQTYQDRIVRDQNGEFKEEGSYVKTQLQNLSKSETSGIEVKLDGKLNTSMGRFGANFQLSKILSAKRQTSVSQPLCDRSKEIPTGLVYGANWAMGAWNTSFDINHKLGFESTSGGFKTGTCDLESPEKTYKVKQNAHLNMQVGYATSWGSDLTFGINNVTNESPAFDPNLGGWPYYDQGAYRNTGTFTYVRLAHEFK